MCSAYPTWSHNTVKQHNVCKSLPWSQLFSNSRLAKTSGTRVAKVGKEPDCVELDKAGFVGGIAPKITLKVTQSCKHGFGLVNVPMRIGQLVRFHPN